MVKYVDSQGLEEILKTSSLPVFCDFWATWCAPCRMLAPVFEEISDKYEGKAVFVKMDVDEENSESAAIKYGITSIPNVIAFKNGERVANSLGFIPAEALEEFVKAQL